MILIALGSNLPSDAGPPERTLRAALRMLDESGARVRRVSPFYRTPAWPDPRDPAFVNAVATIETLLAPDELLRALEQVETRFGRKRSIANAPRTLDLDILDVEGRVEQGPPTLPHPRMTRRAFVLVPLADVAPDWKHPVTGKSVSELLKALPEEERARVKLTHSLK
ncbi:MAG: 2-amino-4-hydroxy-6-hydroxymethyldihydropteridine diphosphokinase [Alphaproteobacteria bacterium]|nr:2-amino-4-hydroxy-6-hydroxymethyldihydropteridine diphosphokinase [Alphaproteobacteria bacterium]MBV9693125.1 2-amino-4-hydroxy-6-hydroxymethyldihydropteridine diphosphokinase [Alphaproteobacteria bacterium]